jgi:hypothetical protein
MSAQASDAPPLEVALAKPALCNSLFYQAMLTIQTLGTAVVPGNRQLDHALELADDANKVARATETVKILKRKAMEKDDLADRRYNFCYKKFREVHDKQWIDDKYHRPKYYVRMLEEEETREKGSLDDIFLDTKKMAKWMKRFEYQYNLPPIPESAVCDICGKGDDASGNLFQCDAVVNKEKRTPCERMQHAHCAGYLNGEEPSVTLHANAWHEERFCCSGHRGEYAPPRNGAAAKAEDAERDEEMIDAAMASESFKTERTKRRQLTREFTKNSRKRQYVVEKEAKKKVPEAPKILLIGNGGAAGAQSVDLKETEVVPNPKARGQFINRTKWTLKRYHKTLTENKKAGAEPHVILMMHKLSSSSDVTFWRRTFLLQWHPDKHSTASLKTKKRIHDMSAIFIEAADRFHEIIKCREEKKDTNADKHDADILAQQEAAKPFDSSDDEETTDDEA